MRFANTASESRQQFAVFLQCFSRSPTWPTNAACRDVERSRPSTVDLCRFGATVGQRRGQKTKKRRGATSRRSKWRRPSAVRRPGRTCGPIPRSFFLTGFQSQVCVAGRKFAEPFVAKVALVPTLGPTESVEESVEFRFAVASVRSVPAALGAGFLGVVPIRCSVCVFRASSTKPKNHLDVADQFGFVERAGEGPNLDPVLAARPGASGSKGGSGLASQRVFAASLLPYVLICFAQWFRSRRRVPVDA